jgi:S1-C subfamily serine protease
MAESLNDLRLLILASDPLARAGLVDRYVQTDVVMYAGFSAGPLVDVAGRVAGLNSSALARGVSVTLPTATVRRVVETLLAHGKVRRGYLGVSTQRIRLSSALAEQVGQETGLLVNQVVEISVVIGERE